jgi:hypothetical protein
MSFCFKVEDISIVCGSGFETKLHHLKLFMAL